MWIISRNFYNNDSQYSHTSYFNNGKWLADKNLAQKFENYYLAESAIENNKDFIDWDIERICD